MQIDFVKDGALEAPFVRIFDLSLGELSNVRTYATDLAEGRAASRVLISRDASQLPNGPTLRMVTDFTGVTVENRHSFLWGFHPPQWTYVSELVEGVMEAKDPYCAHQWLAGGMAMESLAVGEISVLISPSKKGEW
jgi:hypothetical protein